MYDDYDFPFVEDFPWDIGNMEDDWGCCDVVGNPWVKEEDSFPEF